MKKNLISGESIASSNYQAKVIKMKYYNFRVNTVFLTASPLSIWYKFNETTFRTKYDMQENISSYYADLCYTIKENVSIWNQQ